MDIQKIKLEKIQINKDNPRTITKEKFDKLVNSILVFPKMLDIRPIVVDGNFIALGGNQRTEALKAISKMEMTNISDRLAEVSDFQRMDKADQENLMIFWSKWLKNKDVPIINAETLTEDEKKQFIIKDNNSFGEWDFAELAEKWDTNILQDWGVDFPENWALPAEETQEAKEDDFTEEDARAVEARVKAGDIWQLGEHRLMCGDSTKKEDVERLMDGEKADMVFTDPPYGMSAVSKSGVLQKRYKTDIMNDDTNEVAINSFKLCQKMFSNAKQVWWGANYYTECLPSSECWIVWDKNNGANDQTDCELAWANFRSVVRQFTMASEKKDRVHPTQKPIKLITDIIDKFEKDKRFNVIVDLFGGSGSTMMACEQTKRKNFTMELDPHFASVIIARWEKLTGKEAVKIYG